MTEKMIFSKDYLKEKGNKAPMDLEPLLLFSQSNTSLDLSALPEAESTTNHSSVGDLASASAFEDSSEFDLEESSKNGAASSFWTFRLNFLFVMLVVMLADGLQGTHLYVLYDSYGFSVASLYSLGFFAGAISAPIMGPMIDRFGRKKAALVYCALEMWINQLEQYPFLAGLVTSRVVGGITTNLLNVVFEAWVDTEARIKALSREQYEILMRDTVIVGNLAAIASGFLSHNLAEHLGPVGPFEGAVTCTGIAFVVIFFLWKENYGNVGKEESVLNIRDTTELFRFIKADSKILRICIIQGLTLGALHVFIFLWSPLLAEYAQGAVDSGRFHLYGMDSTNAPAYGLIFGAYMAAGVLGGLCSSTFRNVVAALVSPLVQNDDIPKEVTLADQTQVRPMDVELQCSLSYFLCSALLFVPCFLAASNEDSFTVSLLLFVSYEFVVGCYSPSEGMIRSIYIPSERRGCVMAVPTVIVNVAVAIAVILTEKVSKQTSLALVSVMLFIAGCLQLSLLTRGDWFCIWERAQRMVPLKRSSEKMGGWLERFVQWDIPNMKANAVEKAKDA